MCVRETAHRERGAGWLRPVRNQCDRQDLLRQGHQDIIPEQRSQAKHDEMLIPRKTHLSQV